MGTHNQEDQSAVGQIEPRVVALVGARTNGLVRNLASGHRMSVRLVDTPDELLGLIDASATDVALLSTERMPGWPVSEAEKLAARVGGRVPLIVMVDAADDAEVLEQRIAGRAVQIMLRSSLTGDLLADLVATALARGQRTP